MCSADKTDLALRHGLPPGHVRSKAADGYKGGQLSRWPCWSARRCRVSATSSRTCECTSAAWPGLRHSEFRVPRSAPFWGRSDRRAAHACGIPSRRGGSGTFRRGTFEPPSPVRHGRTGASHIPGVRHCADAAARCLVCIDEWRLQFVGHGRKPLPKASLIPAKPDPMCVVKDCHTFAPRSGLSARLLCQIKVCLFEHPKLSAD